MVVGFFFLVTGLVKAFNSRKFIFHNHKYRLLPSKTVLPAAIAFIGIESALGTALILYEFPQWLIPSSIILLIGLSVLTFWSTSSGRTEDCGCYGGIVIVTPQQSIMLNMGYILLLTIAWLNPVPDHHTQTWQWILALVVMGVSGTLAWLSKEKPLVNFTRLKPGNRWKRRWLKHSPQDLQQETHFVVFLSQNCSYCHRWVSFLNVMNSKKEMPQVLGIMSITEEEIAAFKEEEMVRFPIVSMDKLLFGYMVDAFPTAVLIEDGMISSKWVGVIPPELLSQIKQYYEKLVINNQQLDQPILQTPSISVPLIKTTIASEYHYLQIDNFLSKTELNNLLEYVLSQEAKFVSSSTFTNAESYRRSLVLHNFPEFSEQITAKIISILPDIQQQLELPPFIASQIEAQITAHNDGNYYKIHNDNGSIDTSNRELTYVYYFYHEPKPFSGGELVIYDSKIENEFYVRGDNFQTIEPRNNSMVIFPSRYFHEVLPVICPSQTFADSRFTVNGWIRKSLFQVPTEIESKTTMSI